MMHQLTYHCRFHNWVLVTSGSSKKEVQYDGHIDGYIRISQGYHHGEHWSGMYFYTSPFFCLQIFFLDSYFSHLVNYDQLQFLMDRCRKMFPLKRFFNISNARKKGWAPMKCRSDSPCLVTTNLRRKRLKDISFNLTFIHYFSYFSILMLCWFCRRVRYSSSWGSCGIHFHGSWKLQPSWPLVLHMEEYVFCSFSLLLSSLTIRKYVNCGWSWLTVDS